ncbi:MAG: prepilin peptidase [Candidatus Magasanikbacteria bacterium]|nr:prepilin peptidase [Candidatus Magasanikbacteria bacterium]
MTLFYILIFIAGLCLGSFLNALEWRIYNKISLFDARSKCSQCGTQLKWYDNIPLLSFVQLRGKCRACKKHISWQYPLVELSIVVWILSFIFIYDFKYQEVLDAMAFIPAILIFVIKFAVFGVSWQDMAIGAVIGSGFFLLQYLVSKGKWVGGGDIRIGLLMGVILGWDLLLLALWIAYIVGAIVSVILLVVKKKNMKSQIAFGTFLSVATLVVMVWGEGILSFYLSFLY